MATEPQVRGEGELIAGLGTSGIIPERFLVRGMDRLGQMSFITRGTNRFLSLMHMRFSKPKTVETREYKTYEMTELDRTIPVRVASTSTDGHASVGVDNYVAAQFQENDMYHVKGLYCCVKTSGLVAGQVIPSSNTVPTTNKPPHLGYSVGGQPESVHYSTIFGEDSVDNTLFFVDYEQMIVVGVGNADSAGTGYTKITFVRCFRGPGARDMGGMMLGRHAPSLVAAGIAAGGGAGTLTTDMTLLRALPSFPEGTGAPTGFHKNPIIDVNFSQLFKYSVEITKESTIEKTYMGKSQLEVNKMLRMAQMTLDMERAFLSNQKGKSMSPDGKVQYTVGGALEWVPKDRDHIIKYTDPQITYPGLLRLGDKIMSLGGSESRDFYCGLELYTELKIAFYDSGYLRYDEEASNQFDIPVESIVVAGGKWQIHPLYSLSEIGMGNKALIVDNKLPTFTPVTHSGWDMIAEKDIQNKGENIYKELWQGIKGIDRRYSQYLTLVEFPI